MRFLFSLVFFLLALPLIFMFAFERGLLDEYVQEDTTPDEPFIRAELASKTSAEDLSNRVDAALEAGAWDDAAMYAEIAAYMNMPLNPEVQARLEAESAFSRRAARNAAKARAAG